MKRNKKLICIFPLLLLLFGCSSDIEIRKGSSSRSDNSVSDFALNSAEGTQGDNDVPEKNSSPELGERFYAYTMASQGVIYATISEPEYFDNIYDAEIDLDCFNRSIYESQKEDSLRYYDETTGEILKWQSGVPIVFVKVHITVENIDAVSYLDKVEKALREIDPMFKDGYCDKYDFSGNDFGIGIQKKPGAEDILNTTGTGTDYFSLNGKLYTDDYRYSLYSLKPGEKVSFEIGNFLPSVIYNDGLSEIYGGEVGESFIPRYCVFTSHSTQAPCVQLMLQ